MLAVYVGLFGPRFLGVAGPLVFGMTLASVGVGYVCVVRGRGSGSGCVRGDDESRPGHSTCEGAQT